MPKKIISLVLLFFFLFQEVGRTQGVGNASSAYPIKESSSLLSKESRINQNQLRALEARQRYLREQTEQLEKSSSKRSEKNLELIDKQVKEKLAAERLEEKKLSREMKLQAIKIQRQLAREEKRKLRKEVALEKRKLKQANRKAAQVAQKKATQNANTEEVVAEPELVPNTPVSEPVEQPVEEVVEVQAPAATVTAESSSEPLSLEPEATPTVSNEEKVEPEITSSPASREVSNENSPSVNPESVVASSSLQVVEPVIETQIISPQPESPQTLPQVELPQTVQKELAVMQVQGFLLTDTTGAIALYDTQGALRQYQDGKGLEVTPTYDAQGQISGYIEKMADGAIRKVFNQIFNESGELESRQFIDSRVKVQFGGELGDVNTQRLFYKKGELVEFEIENGDYTAKFDADGKQKEVQLSAAMQALVVEEQRKAREADRATWRLVSSNEVLLNKVGLIEHHLRDIAGSRNRFAQGLKISEDQLRRDLDDIVRGHDAFVEFVKRLGVTDDQIWRIRNGRLQLNPSGNGGAEAVRINNTIIDALKASDPNLTVEGIVRAIEVHEKNLEYEKGPRHISVNIHADGNGKLIDRTEVDRVTLEYQVSSLTTTRLFDSKDHLTEMTEAYSKKADEGWYSSSQKTLFKEDGSILGNPETHENFDPRGGGFFSSTLGKILGSVLVGAATFLAPYALPFLAPAAAGVIGVGIAQAGLSLAQGADFKDALISGGLAAATSFVGAQLGNAVSGLTPQGSWLNQFGANLSQIANPALAQSGESVATQFLQNAAIRATSTLVADKFGEKLGAFGTAGVLTAGALLFGGLADGTPGIFSPESLAKIALQSAAQGGVAEAFKNENGLAAQALSQLAGTAVAAIDFGPVAQQIGKVVQGAGQALNALNPFATSVAFAADEPITLNLDILERKETENIELKIAISPKDAPLILIPITLNPNETIDTSTVTNYAYPIYMQTSDGLVKVVGEAPLSVEPYPRTQFDSMKEAILKVDSALRKTTSDIAAGVIFGDFIDQPTPTHIVGQTLGGLLPFSDVRDLVAAGIKYYNNPNSENAGQVKIAMLGFLIPVVGDAIKTASKLSATDEVSADPTTIVLATSPRSDGTAIEGVAEVVEESENEQEDGKASD